MKGWIVTLMTAVFVVGAVQVTVAQGQGQGQGKGHAEEHGRPDDRGKDGHAGQPNHGQIVSECNHRANDRRLKGQDRKDFVEWCESRGARFKFDDRRYDGEKNCYQKANRKGLTGEKRAKFLDKCFAEREAGFLGGRVPVKQKD